MRPVPRPCHPIHHLPSRPLHLCSGWQYRSGSQYSVPVILRSPMLSLLPQWLLGEPCSGSQPPHPFPGVQHRVAFPSHEPGPTTPTALSAAGLASEASFICPLPLSPTTLIMKISVLQPHQPYTPNTPAIPPSSQCLFPSHCVAGNGPQSVLCSNVTPLLNLHFINLLLFSSEPYH